MLATYCKILKASWDILGLGIPLFRWLVLESLYRLFTVITLFLDHIFYPQFRQVVVHRPVFIIGHPRSGTTFLHELLSETGETVTFEFWHILFPALTLRKLVAPFVQWLVGKSWAVILPAKAGHEIALNKIEEEEMLFLHILDTQFVETYSPLGYGKKEYRELRFYDQQKKSHRIRAVQFLKGCFKRQILYTRANQIVAQTHFSTHRILTLLEVFPDARFIYLVRSPLETIPSFFTLLYNSTKHLGGLKKLPDEALKRFFDRRYRASLDLYRYFDELHRNGAIPPGQLMILRYDHMLADLNNSIEKVIAFTGIQPSLKFREAVKQKIAIQKEYKRKHQVMNIEEFGFTREQIKRDFSFVLEEYGFQTM